MADFSPDTSIWLFEATGVDEKNQPYFTSESAKMAWYMSHAPLKFEAQSYQRENRRYCRVDGGADRLRHFDMLGFLNASNAKWILCKILSAEFINPNCTEIEYEVDYMQTYIEDITFLECWVEREMIVGDWVGSEPSWLNLQPEGLETGKMTRTEITELETAINDEYFKRWDIVVLSAYDENGEPNFDIINPDGYCTGLNKIVFSDPSQLSNMLKTYAGKGIELQNAIASVFMAPRKYSTLSTLSTYNVPSPYPTIDGYTVVNSKCFTSEFFQLEISNRRGQEQQLKMENFTETGTVQLRVQAAFGEGSGGALLYPRGYEGHSEDFGVILYNDITCPWVGNVFASWFAQNKVSLGMDIISKAVTGALAAGAVAASGGALSAGVIGVGLALGTSAQGAGAVIGGGQGAAEAMGQIVRQARNPAAIGGQSAGNVLSLCLNEYGFTINWVHPYVQNLKCIDEYFGWFGYRTNRYKVPNVNTRPKWNYVKTADASVRGLFNKTAQIYIENCMNKGVTFWHLGAGEDIDDEWTIEDNKE